MNDIVYGFKPKEPSQVKFTFTFFTTFEIHANLQTQTLKAKNGYRDSHPTNYNHYKKVFKKQNPPFPTLILNFY